MKTVAGVFRSRERAAQAAAHLREAGVGNINLLFPGAAEQQVNALPTSQTEQPGMGKAVGGVLGASLGIAGGLEFGSAAAAILIPGVGPVVALGMAAAAVLGAAGAVGGAAVGAALEQDTTPGLPADELFVYKDALRQGRSVLFVQAPDDDQAARVHQALAQEGAETIDAAREEWWIGLRSAEQEHYHGLGGNFAQDEQAYRRGFEEGVRRQHGVAPGETADRDKVTDQDRADDRAFRCGYERGKTWTQGQPR